MLCRYMFAVRDGDGEKVVTVYDRPGEDPGAIAERCGLVAARFVSQEPEDVQYVVIGKNVWGRGPTLARALKEARRFGALDEWVGYVFPKSFVCAVDGMGRLWWEGDGAKFYPLEKFAIEQ